MCVSSPSQRYAAEYDDIIINHSKIRIGLGGSASPIDVGNYNACGKADANGGDR